MKANEFQILIRKIIREELKMALDDLKENLIESTSSSKPIIKETKTPLSTEIRNQFRDSLKSKMFEGEEIPIMTTQQIPTMNLHATEPEQVGEVDVNFIMNKFLKK